MRTSKTIFPRIFLLILSMVLFSCSGGGNGDGTVESIAENGDDYSLVSTATIGSEGGQLQSENFELIVPSGAFTDTVDLQLFVLSADQPYGANSASQAFRLTGLPEVFSKELEIRIKYQGTLANESFIAVGEEVELISLEDPFVSYRLYEATESEGFLIASISPTATQSASSLPLARSATNGVDKGHSIIGVTSFATHTGEYFKIRYPIYLANYVDDVLNSLNSARSVLCSQGFDCSVLEKPMEVQVTAQAAVPCIICDYDQILIKESAMSQAGLSEIITYSPPTIFSALYYKHNPSWIVANKQNRWIFLGAFLWAQELLSSSLEYVPPQFEGAEMNLFQGLMPGAGMSAAEHGKGAAPLIKYLYSRQFDVLGDFLKGIAENKPALHISELLRVVDGEVADWLPEFYKQYVGGNIYGVQASKFIENAHGLWAPTAQDTQKTFSDIFQDLSARLYSIDLGSQQFAQNTSLHFEVSSDEVSVDDITIIVFSYDGDKLHYIGDGTDFWIADIDQLASADEDLLAVVVNTAYDEEMEYSASTRIDLSLSMETAALPSLLKPTITSSILSQDGIDTEVEIENLSNEDIGFTLKMNFEDANGQKRYSNPFEPYLWQSKWNIEAGSTVTEYLSFTHVCYKTAQFAVWPTDCGWVDDEPVELPLKVIMEVEIKDTTDGPIVIEYAVDTQLADLHITNITAGFHQSWEEIWQEVHAATGNNYQIFGTIEVSNQGTADAPAFCAQIEGLEVRVYTEDGEWKSAGGSTILTDGLAADAAIIIDWAANLPTSSYDQWEWPGKPDVEIGAIADSKSHVRESNEDNNDDFNTTVHLKMPDLEPVDLIITTIAETQDDTSEGSFVLKNNGEAEARDISWKISGAGNSTTGTVASVPAGGQTTVNWSLTGATGTRVTIDFGNYDVGDIYELDEMNNELTVELSPP
jgi:hypothetical protein